MKKKTWIIIAVIIIVVAGIGGSIGMYLFYKPVKNFASSRADLTFTSVALLREFQKDANSANSKFVSNDKTIQISGKIRDLKKNDDGTVTVTLDGGDPDSDISCSIVREESPKTAKFAPGLNVTLKGQCTGYQELINKEVVMIRCGIVD